MRQWLAPKCMTIFHFSLTILIYFGFLTLSCLSLCKEGTNPNTEYWAASVSAHIITYAFAIMLFIKTIFPFLLNSCKSPNYVRMKFENVICSHLFPQILPFIARWCNKLCVYVFILQDNCPYMHSHFLPRKKYNSTAHAHIYYNSHWHS